MEGFNDKDIGTFSGRENQGVRITPIERHPLVNGIPSTNEVLSLQCIANSAADPNEVDTTSTRDLSNVGVKING